MSRSKTDPKTEAAEVSESQRPTLSKGAKSLGLLHTIVAEDSNAMLQKLWGREGNLPVDPKK